MNRETFYEEYYEQARELIKKYHELECEKELLNLEDAHINFNKTSYIKDNYNSKLGYVINKVNEKEAKIMSLEFDIEHRKDMIEKFK